MKLYIEYEIQQKHHVLYELQCHIFTHICKIHKSFRLSVCNSGRVQQPAESTFLGDSALLSNAPANPNKQYISSLIS